MVRLLLDHLKVRKVIALIGYIDEQTGAHVIIVPYGFRKDQGWGAEAAVGIRFPIEDVEISDRRRFDGNSHFITGVKLCIDRDSLDPEVEAQIHGFLNLEHS